MGGGLLDLGKIYTKLLHKLLTVLELEIIPAGELL